MLKSLNLVAILFCHGNWWTMTRREPADVYFLAWGQLPSPFSHILEIERAQPGRTGAWGWMTWEKQSPMNAWKMFSFSRNRQRRKFGCGIEACEDMFDYSLVRPCIKRPSNLSDHSLHWGIVLQVFQARLRCDLINQKHFNACFEIPILHLVSAFQMKSFFWNRRKVNNSPLRLKSDWSL